MAKRITSMLVAAVMLLTCFGTVTAFAAEATPETPVEATTEAKAYTVECTSKGVVSITDENGEVVPRDNNYISGYTKQTLIGNGNTTSGVSVVITPSRASGAGGMGATIILTSSWQGTMSMDLRDTNGNVNVVGCRVDTNQTSTLSNQYHNSPAQVIFTFYGIPNGVSVTFEIWIYG